MFAPWDCVCSFTQTQDDTINVPKLKIRRNGTQGRAKNEARDKGEKGGNMPILD